MKVVEQSAAFLLCTKSERKVEKMLYFTLLQLQEQIKLISQSGLIHVLVWMIVIDISTGITKSFKVKETNSTTGLLGVVKHALVMLLVFVVSVYVPLFGFDRVAQFFVIYLIISYAISIAENWGALGLPMPKFVIERLSKLRDTMDQAERIDVTINLEEKIEKENK